VLGACCFRERGDVSHVTLLSSPMSNPDHGRTSLALWPHTRCFAVWLKLANSTAQVPFWNAVAHDSRFAIFSLADVENVPLIIAGHIQSSVLSTRWFERAKTVCFEIQFGGGPVVGRFRQILASVGKAAPEMMVWSAPAHRRAQTGLEGRGGGALPSRRVSADVSASRMSLSAFSCQSR